MIDFVYSLMCSLTANNEGLFQNNSALMVSAVACFRISFLWKRTIEMETGGCGLVHGWLLVQSVVETSWVEISRRSLIRTLLSRTTRRSRMTHSLADVSGYGCRSTAAGRVPTRLARRRCSYWSALGVRTAFRMRPTRRPRGRRIDGGDAWTHSSHIAISISTPRTAAGRRHSSWPSVRNSVRWPKSSSSPAPSSTTTSARLSKSVLPLPHFFLNLQK